MQNRSNRYVVRVAALSLLVPGLLLAGCTGNGSTASPADQLTLEQKVNAIKNDPAMPEAAKERAIQALQQQQAAATDRGRASGAVQADTARQQSKP